MRFNKKQRTLGDFESMEDRRLFAADLIGAADLVDAGALANMDRAETSHAGFGEYGKPNPEDDGPLGPIGPVVRVISESVLTELGKPNPEDDDPPGPIGPVVQIAEQWQDNEVIQQLGKPAPDDDSPGGPIGPVYHVESLINALTQPELGEQVGQLQTVKMEQSGDAEGKPEPDPDCDGNRLTASCDLKAPELEPEAKPEPEPDCDGNRLTASCDLKAPEFRTRSETRTRARL